MEPREKVIQTHLSFQLLLYFPLVWITYLNIYPLCVSRFPLKKWIIWITLLFYDSKILGKESSCC